MWTRAVKRTKVIIRRMRGGDCLENTAREAWKDMWVGNWKIRQERDIR